MIAVPVFDTAGLLQWADTATPEADSPDRHRIWNQLTSDCVAAAEHIELLEAALAQARGSDAQ